MLGNPASHQDDSHLRRALLEGPSYTRPPSWRGLDVPEVLLSGDHARIDGVAPAGLEQRTRERRPDLWPRYARRQIRPAGNIVLTAWVMVSRAVASSVGCSDSITIT